MIPFPKLHIAESALNRILNTMEGHASPLQFIEPPLTSDPMQLGLQLDEELTAPAAPSEVPPEQQDGAVAGAEVSSLSGGSPFDGAVAGALEV